MLNREEVERPVDLVRVVVILFSVRRRIRILFVFLLVCCVTSHTTGENLAGLLLQKIDSKLAVPLSADCRDAASFLSLLEGSARGAW